MNDKPKSKTGWRVVRWFLVGVAVLVTLAALLVTEEDWRGKRAWESYKQAAEARGEHLDFASIVPPPVPDDQNFFYAPIVAEALSHERNQDGDPFAPPNYRMSFKIYRGPSENWPKYTALWQKGELTDLTEWQNYFRAYSASPEGKTNGFPVAAQPQTPAAAVLLALSCYDPALEELRQASLRPYARMPINYEDGFDAAGALLPWLANMKRCAQFLELRSIADLQNNQSQPALDDVKLLFRLTDSIRDHRFLISHLVRIAMTAISLQPIYEGLAQHRWSDAQLKDLEQVLANEDFLADFKFAMQGEKIVAIETFEKQRITRKSIDGTDNSNVFITNSFRFVPSAFFYQNELNFARMHEQFIDPLVDLTNRIVLPAALHQAQDIVDSQLKHYSYYKIQSLMVFPAIAASVEKYARIQAQVDLAQTACALERYRLAHGEYPDSIDVLAPQFIEKLPHDIINGQPLHYRRTDGGKFILYSVGWDETDDGGQVVLTKTGAIDQKKGDWVWKQN